VWRWLLHACLALLVLATQQGAWRHHLGHWAAQQAGTTETGSGLPRLDALEAPCLQCLAFAATAHGAAMASPTVPTVVAALVHAQAEAHTPCLARATLAYRSRAPPRA